MKTHVLFIQGAGDGAYDEDARMAARLGEEDLSEVATDVKALRAR